VCEGEWCVRGSGGGTCGAQGYWCMRGAWMCEGHAVVQ
jgi:hypothetical protein